MEPPVTTCDRFWSEVRERLPATLPDYLRRQRWFGGKAEVIRSVEIPESIPLPWAEGTACLFLAAVRYEAGHAQRYALPLLAHDPQESAQSGSVASSFSLQLGLERSSPVTLSDALQNPRFAAFLLDFIRQAKQLSGVAGDLRAARAPALASIWKRDEGPLEPSLLGVEQSNSSIRYGERLMLKFFRRVEQGVNLDLEMGRFLTERAAFQHVPPVGGSIEYRSRGGETATLALLQGFAPNRGDAWRTTLQMLDSYLARVPAREPQSSGLPPRVSVVDLAAMAIPQVDAGLLGEALPFAGLLGVRTAQLHLALASGNTGPDFAPEPFTAAYRENLTETVLRLARQTLRLLSNLRPSLPAAARDAAQAVLASEGEISRRLQAIRSMPLTAMRARVHGDYHLGQVLCTESDFVIIDFEGEPERPLAERREKRSPLYDVAGMLRSFHYAAYAALREKLPGAASPRQLEAGARLWRMWVSAAFLGSYLRTAGAACFIPQDRQELGALLDFHLLEKAVYELAYELKNRPGWVSIPLDGILDVLGRG